MRVIWFTVSRSVPSLSSKHMPDETVDERARNGSAKQMLELYAKQVGFVLLTKVSYIVDNVIDDFVRRFEFTGGKYLSARASRQAFTRTRGP